MSITIKKINNETVNPVKLKQNGKGKKAKGENLFTLKANILLLGKKKSGKTVTINKILDSCAGKKTQVIIFAATVFNDDTWIAIVDHLEEKGISVSPFQSLFTDDGKNILEGIVGFLKDKAKEDHLKSKQGGGFKPKLISINSDEDENQKGEGEAKEKLESPNFIFVFDDLSDQLANDALIAFMKMQRHFNNKIILSTQYYTDVPKQARQQLDYLLLFPQLPEMTIRQLWKDTGISIPEEMFYNIYLHATKEPFNFLYLDTKKEEVRKNFSEKYNIN